MAKAGAAHRQLLHFLADAGGQFAGGLTTLAGQGFGQGAVARQAGGFGQRQGFAVGGGFQRGQLGLPVFQLERQFLRLDAVFARHAHQAVDAAFHLLQLAGVFVDVAGVVAQAVHHFAQFGIHRIQQRQGVGQRGSRLASLLRRL
jgi:hypothetical protein